MNLLFNKNKERAEKRAKETDQLDDSDCSDIWELPNWPELQQARLFRDKKIARLKRLRRREERAKLREEQRNHPNSRSLTTLDDFTEDELPEDMKQRGQWDNDFEFLLSIVSLSVGMGNFYRFPFVAYLNGGGAFLIPYLIVLTLIGRPMYLLELALGQFCSFGQVKVWDLSPILRGVGYGSALGSFYVVTFYSAVMGITFFYIFDTFHHILPWTTCDPTWAGQKLCDDLARNMTETGKKAGYFVNLPELYYNNKVVMESDNIDRGLGSMLLEQTGCLLAAWLLIYVIIARGVESSGKAAYITTFYPFTIIIIMLIVACSQPGSQEGMLYFIKPDWGKMLDPNVWFAAVGQCFFSLSVGFGPIINYASYNPFHHNIYKDALVVSVMDTTASFIAGLTVFATLGSIAHSLGKSIDEAMAGGPGLVFIAFSDMIANMTAFPYAPHIMSLLFFSMLLTLAAGSAVAWLMAAISVVCDKYPKLSRFWVTTGMTSFGFLVSLIYVTPGGQFAATLVDNFGGSLNIYILTLLECVGVSWLYGVRSIAKDMEFMLHMKVSKYWVICWAVITPLLLTVVLAYSMVVGMPLTHNGKQFPTWAIGFGYAITTSTLIPIPVLAVINLWKLKGSFCERFLVSLKPLKEFGPRNPTDRERWKLFKKHIITEGGPEAPEGDVYKLPEGELPSLPSFLTILEDGTVLRKDKELEESAGGLEEMSGIGIYNNNNATSKENRSHLRFETHNHR